MGKKSKGKIINVLVRKRKKKKGKKEEEITKPYQLNMFIGAQSFIYRTGDLDAFKKFTGLKELTSENMKEYLYKLNDLSEYSPEPTTSEAKSNLTQVMAFSNAEPKIIIDYLQQIKDRLKLMGAKNKTHSLKMLNRATGAKLKRFPKPKELSPIQLQKLFGLLLRGEK